MNNIKSGLVIAILLGILYGVYTTLSKPDPLPPAGMTRADIDNLAPPDLDFGTEVEKVGHSHHHDEDATPKLPPKLDPPPEEASPADVPPTAEPPMDNGGSIYGTPSDNLGAETSPADTNPKNLVRSGPSKYANPHRKGNDPSGFAGKNSAPPLDPSNPDDGSADKQAGVNLPLLPGDNSIIENPAQKIHIAQHDFSRALETAGMKANEHHFREALAILSPFYSNPHLPLENREVLLSWLDALAARVIYSPEHLLEQPYVVQGSKETLYTVADHYQVPFQLLQNINSAQVKEARILLPGTELKVVQGPFRAEVDLKHSEVTLFLGDLYAGRFPFTMGSEVLEPGNYTVQDKQTNREYYGVDRTIAGDDPSNPYGSCWIGLDNGICIHGSPAMASTNEQLGCISLSPRDATDIFGILSKGSTVVIHR